ncbi:MAG: peptidylprolyl isomerase, partial [Nitrospinota bacterium]
GEIVVKELKFNEARRQGISVDPESIEADVKKMEKRMASTGATLDEALAKQGRDRNWLRDFILKSRVVKILEDRVTQNIALEVKKKTGDDVVRAFYAENLDKFKEPDKVRILEILLKVPPGSPPKDWEKSKEKANWLIKRARAGDPFRSLAREFSDDSYAEKGGDMGLLKVTSLMGELSAVVSKMKVGDVAGPVYSIYGHHVVKLIDQKKGVQKPFESVRERITEHLSRKEKKNMFREWLDGLREKVVVEYLYDFEEEKMKG